MLATENLASDIERRVVAWPGTEEWHAKRRLGIGASEVAAVVGLSPYDAPISVYLRKTGEDDPFTDNRAMRVGRRLEPVVISEFCEETGESVKTYPCPLIAHPEHSFMLATPDADLESGRLCEAKTASIRTLSQWGPSGTDEIPTQYLCQTAWQLAVSGRDECSLAVLIGGDELRIYNIERNERLIEQLTEAAAAFWQCVISRTPPEIDPSHPKANQLLKSLYDSVTDSEIIDLSPESRSAWLKYEELGREIRELEAERDRLKAAVQIEIADHLGGSLGDGRFVKRSLVSVKEKIVAPYSYIKLQAVKR